MVTKVPSEDMYDINRAKGTVEDKEDNEEEKPITNLRESHETALKHVNRTSPLRSRMLGDKKVGFK